MKLDYCEECGAPLVKSPSGLATCPSAHGRLKQKKIPRTVWIERLVECKTDVREIPVVSQLEVVGPRGGKKKSLKIGERVVRRASYRKPLGSILIAELEGKLGCFYFAD